MADDDSSELSSLSSLSPAPSEDEADISLQKQPDGILRFFHKIPKDASETPKEMSPPPRKRSPSPEHQYVLADNPDIAFIVMFRKRFKEELPKTLPHFGPLELESDIVESVPGERVERFLCAILVLLLNRKQDIKPGHYNRALEDAIKEFSSQWPVEWEGKSPLAAGGSFNSMTPTQRLLLLKYLIYWSLAHSDTIKTAINKSYKQNRHEDDLNQPLSVQPWGSDGDKRRYFLIEGEDDSSFRIYRESNPAGFNRTWWSVAGSIPEVKALAEKLTATDRGPNAKKLVAKINNAIPGFEEKEEKRKKREYRRTRKEQFRRPEPGLSLYEGRTRGKRAKYTYSDDEDFYTDSTNRRSTRNTRNHTPMDQGPVITASGRQSRPVARLNAETLSSGAPSAPGSVLGDAQLGGEEDVDMEDREDEVGPTGRPRRSAAVHHGMNGWAGGSKKRRKDYVSDDEDDSEPDFGDDEEDDHVPDESEEEDEEEFEDDREGLDEEELGDSPDSSQSRVVKLHIKVDFDKDGKASRMANSKPKSQDTPSPSSPSDVRSAPSPSENSGSPASPLQVSTGTPEHTGDVVNVALKRKTPEPVPQKPAGDVDPTVSLTPSSGVSTSLAFRGSPDKVQHIPRPINIVNGE